MATAPHRTNPTRAKSSESSYSLMEFMAEFPDDATCLEWLWRTRYVTFTDEKGQHAMCPKCSREAVFRKYDTKQARQSWTCTACGFHLHPTAGTIFHKSSTPLHLWFYAMYLMTSTRCGISAKQLERELGVTYKTAWRMFTLIRNELMAQDRDEMGGEVEMDEMYVGGKPRQSDRNGWGHLPESSQRRAAAIRWSQEHKTPVFGMVERGGKVAAYVVPQKPQQDIMGHIRAQVAPDAIVYTDDARIYDRLSDTGREHYTINHSERVYVSGAVHTQTIEGFWSLVKRGILGTHVSVSRKWLQGYLNEYAWRYNHRNATEPMFLTMLRNSAQECRSLPC